MRNLHSRFGWPVLALTAGCLAVIGLGTATAAVGSPLVLGHRNSATATTRLGNPDGVPLRLHAPAGSAPLQVDSNVLVPHLNVARVGGQTASSLVAHARSGLLPSAQVEVRRDGTIVVGSTGITVARNAAGDYTVSWTGMPGRAFAYCTGIGRTAAVAGEYSTPDGGGYVRVVFGGIDTRFTCTVVSSTG